jgi:hypothetical protein
MKKFTVIRIRKTTREVLKKLGTKGESYEQIILSLIKFTETIGGKK